MARGAAVVFANDDVLSHVHQATGQITGVSCSQGGVHQTLTGAVGGDDVFGDRETFAEVGADRQVDDLALGIGHQAPHAHQLSHLGHVSPGAGVGHHPDRIQRCVLVEVLLDRIHQTLIGLSPGVDDLGVTLHLRDLTQPVTLLRGCDLLLGLSEQGFFRLGNLQIVHGNRNRRLSGVAEAEILELVGH